MQVSLLLEGLWLSILSFRMPTLTGGMVAAMTGAVLLSVFVSSLQEQRS